MAKQKLGHEALRPKITSTNFFMKHVSEGGFILVLTLALFIFLSLLTYHVSDYDKQHAFWLNKQVQNAGGQVGAYVSALFYFVFGYFSFAVPILLIYFATVLLIDHRMLRAVHKPTIFLRSSGLLLLSCGSCGLLNLEVTSAFAAGMLNSGGWFGKIISHGCCLALNTEGALLSFLAMILVGITWLTSLSWINVVEHIGRFTWETFYAIRRGYFIVKPYIERVINYLKERRAKAKIENIERPMLKPNIKVIKEKKERSKPTLMPVKPNIADQIITPPITPAAVDKPVARNENLSGLPNLDLLVKGSQSQPMGGYLHQELEVLSREVEQHLLDFGIQVDVVAVHPGPVITRFELQLAAGIKVSRLTALAKDLARSLSVTSVRVVEIIPGKTVVGIELPNPNRAMVSLAEVLSADVYQQAHSPLTLALGVDIAGHPMVVDLAKMPHLLVAGTTGSGKSVGINAMILSILFKASPEQVRLIMVDPKMLELSVYDGIPHLLTPVVTDMKEAASALRWCVAEMERRYRLMATLGVRNLAGYNAKITDAKALGEEIMDPLWKPTDSMEASPLTTLPYVVVIIDELADMMMVVGKKVEQLIARIAQKARAAGIHLILATQRPSVDVLTGLIKSNIPTRISFQVSSKIDSRTILDQQGAEQLLGHGDMLFLAPGTGAPLRVHGAFVDDKEVHRVADDWRSRGVPNYIDDILKTSDSLDGEASMDNQATEDADPLYDQAVEFVIQTRKASISSVQRRFKIGYNRAARLVEEMERTGLVGPMDGGFRDVLVSHSEDA